MSNLTSIRIWFLACVAMFLCLSVASAQTVQKKVRPTWSYVLPLQVKEAIEKGNSVSLASYFGGTVDMQLPNCAGIFSKRQAEMILSKFLAAHDGLVLYVKSEKSTGDADLTIGSLVGDGESFVVYILHSHSGGVTLIKQLRIEIQR